MSMIKHILFVVIVGILLTIQPVQGQKFPEHTTVSKAVADQIINIISQNDENVVEKYFKEHPDHINQQISMGQTPLMRSVLGGQEASVKKILEMNADCSIGIII